MKIIVGDLFSTRASALGHGVNCRGAMGAGIAPAFKKLSPAMYQAYRGHCQGGTLQPGMVFPWTLEDGRVIYNMATQDRPGRHARLEWVATCASKVLTHADLRGIDEVAIPRIGCGIGGLQWEAVQDVLEDAEEGCQARFLVYSL